MKLENVFMSIETLLGLRKKNMMFENLEYQRGKVWTRAQQQLLIDSILRDYSIPSFHLHFREDKEGSLVSQRFEVIDGQQRLRALSAFREGQFKLLDPQARGLPRGVLFTSEAKRAPCRWAGKAFQDLHATDRIKFLETELIVVKVTEASEEEVRDLFIRQQGGTPLKPQEIRDAWPGGMTNVILEIGGKQGLDRCPGHDFFRKLARNPGQPAGRQMAAQMFSLLVAKLERKEYADIARGSIDQFYYDHLSMTDDDPRVKGFRTILNTLVGIFDGKLTSKLVAHEAIALMLLTDEWLDSSASGWQEKLPGAFDEFRVALSDARRRQREGELEDPYWLKYGVYTQTKSDQGSTIRLRQHFFREKMTERISPTATDPQRVADPAVRDTVFRKQDGKCKMCDGHLRADQFELHHIVPHSEGGKTIPQNLVALHAHCHPKSKRKVEDFRRRLSVDTGGRRREARRDLATLPRGDFED